MKALPWWIVGALMLVIVVSQCRYSAIQRRAQNLALRADAAAAAADTTRLVLTAALQDTARAYERRIVQHRVRADDLDRALDRESRMRARLEARIAVLQTSATTTVAAGPDDSVRSADWRIRDPPYTVAATARLTRLAGDLDLDIRLDPLRLSPRVQCGDPVDGIRPAFLEVTGPQWATIELAELEQDPAVCQAPRGLPRPARRLFELDLRFGSLVRMLLACGAGAGAGRLAGLGAGESLTVGAACAVVSIAF